MNPNLTDLTLEELNLIIDQAYAERRRRETMDSAVTRIAVVQGDYLAARDRGLGNPPPEERKTIEDWPYYQAPTGPHDSYPAGWVVREGDSLYRAETPPGQAVPGQAEEWVDVTAEILPDN